MYFGDKIFIAFLKKLRVTKGLVVDRTKRWNTLELRFLLYFWKNLAK